MERAPLSIQQTDKVLLISEWLSRMAVVQSELQMAERWDLLEELRKIYMGLSKYLLQIVGGTDDLDSEDWELRLFTGLIKSHASIAAHKASVEDGVKWAIENVCQRRSN